MVFIFKTCKSLMHVRSKLSQNQNGKLSHSCSNLLLPEIPSDLSQAGNILHIYMKLVYYLYRSREATDGMMTDGGHEFYPTSLINVTHDFV